MDPDGVRLPGQDQLEIEDGVRVAAAALTRPGGESNVSAHIRVPPSRLPVSSKV